MILVKGGVNYFDLNLDAQTFQTLKFYHVDVGSGNITAVNPSAEWLAANPPIDVGAQTVVDFIVARVQEYAVHEMSDIGIRYILV